MFIVRGTRDVVKAIPFRRVRKREVPATHRYANFPNR